MIMPHFCCDEMRARSQLACDVHDQVWDCPDVLAQFTPALGRYGLIVHDGGTASISISYCPWCGLNLSDTPS